MAKLYADENFKYEVVEHLRRLGHDVLTVQEAGRRGSSDAQVLQDATADSRAVLTFNRKHFVRLHSTVLAHQGIVVCTDDDAAALADRIHKSIVSLGSLENQLLRINRPP